MVTKDFEHDDGYGRLSPYKEKEEWKKDGDKQKKAQ